MHSLKYIPSGSANDWKWAATLNDGEIDAIWKEIEEKNTMRGKPVKAAELHEGGYLDRGAIAGSKMLKRLAFLSICWTEPEDGVANYYTSHKDDIHEQWGIIEKTGRIFGKKVARATMLEGGEIKPNGFVYGGKEIAKYPAD